MASPSVESIKPFTLAVPDDEVSRLQRQLLDARPPASEIVPDAGDDYGISQSWVQALLAHWRDDFSWPRAQQRINSLSQYTTEIEGLTIHFVHERSRTDPDAIPLLLLHGWPGSFYEFSEIIGPLTTGSTSAGRDPANTGEPSPSSQQQQQQQQPQQTFHCVAPSLPGFTFSSTPPRRGWTVKDTARVLHTLMQRLGYGRGYGVQAGDWGQFVARELGANPAYAHACRAVHLNYCPGALPEELTEGELSGRERGARERGIDWRTRHVGYAVLMRTRPATLGWMLADSPLGLLAFVGEKYYEAAAPAVHADVRWRDHVLTTVCLYYFSRCIGTSGLIYYENAPHHEFAAYAVREENLIRCPFGYTSFWFDTAPNSRRAVERTGKLVFYRERDYAGHFAALEDPMGLCQDVREVMSDYFRRDQRDKS